MPITAERINTLQRLGLSEYGARAYLALLDLGTATARDVATLGRVPNAKVYAALDQLHEKGLVGILPEHPRRYTPVPIESYLEQLKAEKQKEMMLLDRNATEFADAFRIVGETELSDKGAVNVVRGRKNVLKTMEQTFSSAKEEILILATPGFVERARAHRDVLRDATARGIEVRVLAPPTAGFDGIAERHPNVQWRVRSADAEDRGLKSKVVIVDRAKAFVVNFAPDDASLSTGKDVGILTDHRGIVQVMHGLVESLWLRSKPLKSASVQDSIEARVFTRTLRNRADILAANNEIVDRGARSLVFVRTHPPDTSGGFFREFMARLHADPAFVVRAIHNFAEASQLDAYSQGLPARGDWDIAHTSQPLALRFWIYDEREAFLALSRPATVDSPPREVLAEQEESVLHTNNPEIVLGLLNEYERLRREAIPLHARAAEIESAPVVRLDVETVPPTREA